MGWHSEAAPGHEGFAVALVERVPGAAGMYRELAYPADDADREDVRAIQAGCECGWRSHYLRPREPAGYTPFVVWLGDADRARARALWSQHVLRDGHQPAEC